MKKSNFFVTAFFFLTFYFLLLRSANAQYTKLFDFADTANGLNPYGSLISDGTFLYGMTLRGGLNYNGVIFKIKPDGTGYSKLWEFADTVNGINPNGSLFYDGTFLYGMAGDGGTNNSGVIFKIKPDGSDYTKLLGFTGSANGSSPMGSLLYDGTFLYGMTLGGGTGTSCAGGCGTIFKIKPDGTGYFKLLDFTGSNGSYPRSLISDGIFLYGLTQSGGISDLGVLFKIKPDGTGYFKLLDFTGSNGSQPYGSLISDGTFLYGMTEQGGTNNMGTIFKYQLATSVSQIKNVEFPISISPNPTTGKIKINLPAEAFLSTEALAKVEAQAGSIKIYNVFGQQIFQSSNSNLQSDIDLSSQPSGIYFLYTNINGQLQTFKIIKM